VIDVAAFDRARARIAASGFDADTQTRIALLLGTTTNLNAALLAPGEWMPARTSVFPFMHGQYFRECEFSFLLARVTHWSANPSIYLRSAVLTEPLWREWLRIQMPPGPLWDGQARYRALAFGHALLARVRLAPVIPADCDSLSPFVVALRRIEQENGRMIQTQIRLLKETPLDLPTSEREAMLEEAQAVVDDVFARFLEWLAADADMAFVLPIPRFGARTG
jgi:hypothetical protein